MKRSTCTFSMWPVALLAMALACSSEERFDDPTMPMPMQPGGPGGALADQARAGNVAGGTPGGNSGGVPVGDGSLSTMQPGDEEGDQTWTVEEDIDDDGDADSITILYDDETGIVYLVWRKPVEVEGCSDLEAVMVVAVQPSGEYTVAIVATCQGEDILYGCSYDAEDTCSGCGACTADDGLACELTDPCE